jgi:plasmid stabilization system protein ParE
MDVIIAPKARSDIASILAWTEENFGPQTLKRYGKLIATAIEQVAENPELAGSTQRRGRQRVHQNHEGRGRIDR